MSRFYRLTDTQHRGLFIEDNGKNYQLIAVKNGELVHKGEFYLTAYNLRDSHVYDEYEEVTGVPSDYAENMTNLLQVATEMAEKAHAGQVDKNGEAYINHPKRVADSLEFTEDKIIAMLHDTLEDTGLTEKDLAQVFPTFIVEAVKTLTRNKEQESYEKFIQRIVLNDVASDVKLADVRDNLDRPLQEPDEELKKRYEMALEYLEY